MTTEQRRAQWRRYSQSERGRATRRAYQKSHRDELNAKRRVWSRRNWPDIKVAKTLGVSLEEARRIE